MNTEHHTTCNHCSKLINWSDDKCGYCGGSQEHPELEPYHNFDTGEVSTKEATIYGYPQSTFMGKLLELYPVFPYEILLTVEGFQNMSASQHTMVSRARRILDEERYARFRREGYNGPNDRIEVEGNDNWDQNGIIDSPELHRPTPDEIINILENKEVAADQIAAGPITIPDIIKAQEGMGKFRASIEEMKLKFKLPPIDVGVMDTYRLERLANIPESS